MPRQGRDHTIYSLIEGHVQFSRNPRTKRRFISVEPLEGPAAAAQQQQRRAAAAVASPQRLPQQQPLVL